MKKRYISLMLGVLCAAMFGGCGDGTEGEQKVESGPVKEVTSQPIMSETERVIADYENKYSTGEFTAEDYKGLADVYGQEGYIRKQRDLMEQGYRLNPTEETFNALQNITVNILEEDSGIQEEVQRLKQNLSIPEYRNEAVGMLCSQDWLDTVMPKVKQGHRNYYLKDSENNETLYIQAGYNENGNGFSKIWYLEGDRMLVIMQSAGTIQMVETGFADGHYQGAFDSWLCASETGDVYHETGTFEAGIYSGSYTAQVHFGTEAVDLFALWSTRESMEFTSYTGEFGTEGTVLTDQPSDKEKKTVHGGIESQESIVYAYDEDKKNYLFLSLPEGTEKASFTFDCGVLGLEAYPAFVEYDPRTEESSSDEQNDRQINASDVKVRIYDSNIEWFDGVKWHSVGSVEEYMMQDPFKDLSGEGQIPPGVDGSNSQSDAYGRRGGGTIQKAQTDTPSSKPAQNKPSNNTKPAKPTKPVTPTPSTPASEPPQTPDVPEPSDTPDNGGGDGGDGGNGGSGSGDNGGGNNGGDNGNPPDAGGDNGGDVDIEWTPDIL